MTYKATSDIVQTLSPDSFHLDLIVLLCIHNISCMTVIIISIATMQMIGFLLISILFTFFLSHFSKIIDFLMHLCGAQIALEAVSAVHQLTSAFHTLSLCVRPLITAGFPLASADVDGMAIENGSVSSANQLTPEQVCRRIFL